MKREILAVVYARTDGHCWYCGVFLPPFSNWQVDHQDPVSKGGDNSLSNLVPACQPCNSRKSNRDVGEYEQYLISQISKLLHKANFLLHGLSSPTIKELRETLETADDYLRAECYYFWGDGTTKETEDFQELYRTGDVDAIKEVLAKRYPAAPNEHTKFEFEIPDPGDPDFVQ